MGTLHAIAEGPTSAVATTFGVRLDDIAVGRVGGQVPARPSCVSGLGSALVLAGITLGAAVSSTAPDAGVQTLRLQASTTGSPAAAEGTLRGASWLSAQSEGSATSSEEIRTDDDQVAVTMSCRCAVRAAAPAGPGPGDSPEPEDVQALDDPWMDLDLCAVHTGADPCLPALAPLRNLSGVVQGGVIAAVLTHTAESRLAFPPGAATLDLDVAYPRGVAADGTRLPVTVDVLHQGRRYRLARATLLDRDGRPVAVATVGAYAP